MNKFLIGVSLILATFSTSQATSPSTPVITWENLGHIIDDDGNSAYIERFVVSNAPNRFSRLAFCVNKHDMQPLNALDTIVELLPGYYAVGSPRFADVAPGDSVVVDVLTKGWLHNTFEVPDGMHLVDGANAIASDNIRKSFTERKEQYLIPGDNRDPMIYGPEAFAINDSLRTFRHSEPYMQIPTPKSVRLTGDYVKRPALRYELVTDPRHDYYQVKIEGDTAAVYTNSAHPEVILTNLQRRLDLNVDGRGLLPKAEIEDWADYDYRGMMIDVARNFTSKNDIMRIISLLSRYGINVLHFHLGDDEGWRVEIPGLPELTEVGGRRGYTVDDNVPFLKQIYGGNGNPDASTPANGYYTEEDFIDLLRYANSLGIDVIPEFDSPGHSRAAIRAMEHRYRTTGDDSLRLIHDGDTSRYSTAQYFHDNMMNPALEGPYRFWSRVMDGVIDIYNRAEVPLRAINVGGDEVPAHAWDGSDIARRFMADKGMTSQRELHAYFVSRLAEMAKEKGVKIAGWQEIALDHSPEYDATVAPSVEAVNSWTNAGPHTARMIEAGYPVVLSNVDYLYFDQTPNTHPEEPGFIWGGLVDEFRPLHATAVTLCDSIDNAQDNVKGISAHLFAETVRNAGMVERYILPRLLGLAERAHNASATITDEEYFALIKEEMPRWTEEGLQCYLRQPGIRLTDCMIEMNEPYGFGEIRYTLDGSDPSRESLLYTGPFPATDAPTIRARLFFGPSHSVTSIINLH